MLLSQLSKKLNCERAVVLGHGVSAQWFINAPLKDEGLLTLGVNDHAQVFGWDPDVLVVLDTAARFAHSGEGRAVCVMNTRSRYVVTQQSKEKLPLTFAERVSINLNNRRGEASLNNPDVLDISLTSPFVAVQVAYWLGAKDIEVFGVDFEGHHLMGRRSEIMEHFGILFDALKSKGCNARFGEAVPSAFKKEIPAAPKKRKKK